MCYTHLGADDATRFTVKYTIIGIILTCEKCESWTANLQVMREHAPFEIAAILHPHATNMATGVVTDGPDNWIERILVLEMAEGTKPLRDWEAGYVLEDAFAQLPNNHIESLTKSL